jgi:hypothetical protein
MFQRLHQFGLFLLMVGGLLIVLFVGSYAANQIDFWLFLAGALITYVGYRFLIRFPAEERPRAERFRLVKKLSSRRKKTDAARDKDKKKSKENEEEEEEEQQE